MKIHQHYYNDVGSGMGGEKEVVEGGQHQFNSTADKAHAGPSRSHLYIKWGPGLVCSITGVVGQTDIGRMSSSTAGITGGMLS